MENPYLDALIKHLNNYWITDKKEQRHDDQCGSNSLVFNIHKTVEVNDLNKENFWVNARMFIHPSKRLIKVFLYLEENGEISKSVVSNESRKQINTELILDVFRAEIFLNEIAPWQLEHQEYHWISRSSLDFLNDETGAV